MTYRDEQRLRATTMRDALFRDPGNGVFFKRERQFVLRDAALNLWAGIREDAIGYFKKNSVSWWMGEEGDEPTGHLLSSQVACLNHLYFMRQRIDVATAVLKNVWAGINQAIAVDSGYVEFEVVGAENYLGERLHTRGANATSVDALMVGKKSTGSNILILIEWKYTEEYREENKYIPERYEIYNKLLNEEGCPIIDSDHSALYYEPFYQLMRQTLLGWKMVQNREYQCDELLHLHIIPSGNVELRDRVTSPSLRPKGGNMSEAWKSVLEEPIRYIVITPEDFLKPALDCEDTRSIAAYLEKRYWGS